MRLQVKWIDVNDHLRQGIQPVFILKRSKMHDNPKAWAGPSKVGLGQYWVAQEPAQGIQTVRTEEDAVIGLSRVSGGEVVRIPVLAFRTRERAQSAILAVGLEIGMAAVCELRNHVPDTPFEATLVLGNECHDLYPEPAFRCYVGLALRTK